MSSNNKNNADSKSASITFNWVGHGKDVGIMGAFGLHSQPDWVPMPMTYSNELKGYQISLELEQEKMYQYKFVVDGDRICDPKADTTNDSEGHMNNTVYIPLIDPTPSGHEAHNVISSTVIAKEGENSASRKASLSLASDSESSHPTTHDSSNPTGAERHVSFDPATLGEHYEPVDLSDPEGCPKKSNYISENVYYSKSGPKSLEPITEADKDFEHNADSCAHSNESTSKAPRHAEGLKLPYKSRRRGLPKFNSLNPSPSDASKEPHAHVCESQASGQDGEHHCHDGDQAGNLRCLAESQSNKRFDEETQGPAALDAASEEPATSTINLEALSENDVRSSTPPPEALANDPELVQPCSGEAQYATLDPSSTIPSRKLSGADVHYSEEAAQVNTGPSYMDSSTNADGIGNEAYATEDIPAQARPYDNQQYAEGYDLPVATKETFENDADLVDNSAEMSYANADAIPDSSDLSYDFTPGTNAHQQASEHVEPSSNRYELNAEAVEESKEEEVHTGYYCPVSRKFTYGVAPPEEVQEGNRGETTYASQATLAPKESVQYGGAPSRKQSDANDGLSSYYDPVQRKFIIVSQEAPVEATGNQAYGSSASAHQSAYFDAASGKFVIGTKPDEEAQAAGYSAPSKGYAPQETYFRAPSPYEAHANTEASRDKLSSYFDPNTGTFVHGYQHEPAHHAAPQEAYVRAPNPHEAQPSAEATLEKPSSYFDVNTGTFVQGYQHEPAYPAAPQEAYARAPSPYEAQPSAEASHEEPSSYFDINTGTFVYGYHREPSHYAAPQETYVRAPRPYEVQSTAEASYGEPSHHEANTGNYTAGYQREPAHYAAPQVSYEKPSHYDTNAGKHYQREPYHYAAAPQEAYAKAPSPYEATHEKPSSYFDVNTGTFVHGYQREPVPQVYVSKPNTYEAHAMPESSYEKPTHYSTSAEASTGYQREPAHYASKPTPYEAQAEPESYEKPSSYFDANTGTFVHGYQHEPAHYASKPNTYEAQPATAEVSKEPIQYAAAYAGKPDMHGAHTSIGEDYERPSTYIDESTKEFDVGSKPETVEEVPQIYVSQPETNDKAIAPGYYDFSVGKFIHDSQNEPEECNPEPSYPVTEEQEPTETSCPATEEQEPNETGYPATEEQKAQSESYESTAGCSQPVPIQEPSSDACTSCGKPQEKTNYPTKSEAQEKPHSEIKPSRPVPQRKPTVVGEHPHNSEPAPKKSHESSDSLNDSEHGSQHGSILGSKVTAKWRPIFKKVAPGKLRMVNEQQNAPKPNGHCNSSRGAQYHREAGLTFDADMDHSYGKAPNNYHTQTDNRDMYPSEYMDGTHEDPQEEDFLNQLGQDSGPQTPREPKSPSFMKGSLLSEMPFFSKTTLAVFAAVYMMASFKGPSSSLSIMMVLPLLCLLALCVATMNITSFIKHNNIGWKCNDNLTISIFQNKEHASTHAITLNTNHVIIAFFLALGLVGVISMISISGFYVVGAFAKRSCY